MKTFLWIGSICLLIMVAGCRKELQENKTLVNKTAFDVNFFEESPNRASFDLVIQRQYNNLLNMPRNADYVYDHEYFSYLLTRKELSDIEDEFLQQTLSHLGFLNMEELHEYDKVIKDLSEELYKKTNFFEESSPESYDMFMNYFSRFAFQEDKSCINTFSLCINEANAEYTYKIIGCTGVAIGLGALSGWGGLVFQLACSGAALWGRNSRFNVCLDNYDNCQ